MPKTIHVVILTCLCALVAGIGAAPAGASGSGLTGPVITPPIAKKRDIPREIVRIARAEFLKGIQEVPRGSNNSPRIARYRAALTPRPRSGPWCAYFASWVTQRAGVPIGARGRGIAGAAGVRAWAQRTGRWVRSPRPGDLAVYGSEHVGVVVSVAGSRMTTIEGNWSDRVSRLNRARGEAYGFARVAVGDHRIGHR